MKPLFICLFSLVLFFSCNDDKKSVAPIYVEDKDIYQPQTTGSHWVYIKDTSTQIVVDSMLATEKDTVINGFSYKQFSSLAGRETYHRRFHGNYYQYNFTLDLSAVPDSIRRNLDDTLTYDLLYLKDNMVVGQKWENSQPYVFYKYKLVFEVLEVNATKIVNGVTYNNVATVKMNLLYGFNNDLVPLSGIEFIPVEGFTPQEFSYAKNVGMLRNTWGQILKSYEIK